MAYLGAHQAGFARKPPQHAAVAAAAAEATETSKRIKAATGPAVRDIKAEHDAHRHIAAAVEAKPQAKPQAAAAKKAVALPVAAQERKRAMAARAMPQSSDEEVPEMGTNVVFQGASAVRAALFEMDREAPRRAIILALGPHDCDHLHVMVGGIGGGGGGFQSGTTGQADHGAVPY